MCTGYDDTLTLQVRTGLTKYRVESIITASSAFGNVITALISAVPFRERSRVRAGNYAVDADAVDAVDAVFSHTGCAKSIFREIHVH